MSVLICKNITKEGPGTIEDFLVSRGIPFTAVDLSAGNAIPRTKEFDILVMMGGPMSANEADIYPYIKEEERLVQEFIAQGKGVFGVCLGAQIMAKALGSRVYPGREKEIGWYDIELSEDGLRDPLMRELATHPRDGSPAKTFKVFHWHGETFDIPQGAVRLAGSALYPNQAFRYGNRAYAFQFHIEVKKEMVYDWLKNENVDFEKLKAETERLYDVYHARAYSFYEAFL